LDWKSIKDKVYFLDGSLRDIYVLGTDRNDWSKWVDFVNTNYKISFHNYETEITHDKIDFSVILDFWNGNRDSASMATVFIDKIIIHVFFFDEEEIENDITPTEINSMEDHNKLIKYLVGLSKALNKPVVMTPENERETILIEVDNEKIKFDSR
jgi:hypothetical protein